MTKSKVSPAEKKIRDAVVIAARQLIPNARIIHELNTAGQGSPRMDIAAVTREHIVGFEVKSSRDKLDRLDGQWEAFNRCCHLVIVAVHRKHFHEHDLGEVYGHRKQLRLKHHLSETHRFRRSLWCFEAKDGEEMDFGQSAQTCKLPVRSLHECLEPRSTDMLGMLWRDELYVEAMRHSLDVAKKATMFTLRKEMSLSMTGKEIRSAVCRQLRQREFAMADERMVE